ncbi:MAG: hypothetical protein ABW005_08850, partial [Burkholderiaceae bacterium]
MPFEPPTPTADELQHWAQQFRRFSAEDCSEDPLYVALAAAIADAPQILALLAAASADRSDEVAVSLPATVSATVLMRARSDPAALARDLARPLPRRPSEAARFGSRFHAWVEA